LLIKNDQGIENFKGIAKYKYDSLNAKTTNANENFSDLLHDCLKQAGIPAVEGAALPPLQKDQIALLIKSIQIQMNRQLFNAVFNNGEEKNISVSRMLPKLVGDTNISSLNASKNRQITPKNDTNNSRNSIDKIIEKTAGKYNVDPDLIRSVIKAESDFTPEVTSPKGAMGLMQLMPETAKELGVKNVYDPEENITGGTKYLKLLLDRYDGKVDLALAAYNWGMGNLERDHSRLPRETANYIARVNSHYKNLKETT
jgi:soluble lytic murein transglycosylase-like protein